MNILVTGGLGFVGINLVRVLAQQASVQVIAADLLPWDESMRRFLEPVGDRVTAAHLDVRDAGALQELIANYQITTILHAAAITATEQQERERTAEVVAVNLVGAINVLNCALSNPRVERVLLVSSSGVYGTPHPRRTKAQQEGDTLDLSNLYAITKYSAELLAARYAQLSGKRIASVRLPAVYGPMERPLHSRSNISTIGKLMTALRQDQMIRVTGATIRRDWTYAAEIGSALALLLKAARWRHSVYNVSCGVAISFAEVVETFAAHGLRYEWVDDPSQADVAMRPQQERTALNISRLQRETGFYPRYSLELGVQAWLDSGLF